MRLIYPKILLSFVAVLLVNLVVATALVIYSTKHGYSRNLEEHLSINAHTVAELVRTNGLTPEALAPLQETVRRLGQEIGLRVTVIRADGVVLADSTHDPATMENHLARPEIQDALRGIEEARHVRVRRWGSQ